MMARWVPLSPVGNYSSRDACLVEKRSLRDIQGILANRQGKEGKLHVIRGNEATRKEKDAQTHS